MGVWFYVRLFMSFAGGTLVGYVAFLILEYYYPTRLDKRLKKWRYMPRVNPKTGNKMRLLAEHEEDVHLDEGMRAEEDVFSIDYDVWFDAATNDVLVEKYPGHMQALQCGSCGFFTLKVVREEITQKPTLNTPGELIKHYECSYCKSVRATAFKISTMEGDEANERSSGERHKKADIEPDTHLIQLVHSVPVDEHRRANCEEYEDDLKIFYFPAADIIILSLRGIYRGDFKVVEYKHGDARGEHEDRANQHCLMPYVKKRTGLNIFHIFGLMDLNIKIKTFNRAHLYRWYEKITL